MKINSIRTYISAPKWQLIFLCVLITCTSGFTIGTKSIWLDEGLTISMTRDWQTLWQILTHTQPWMWTYLILLHFWMKFGLSEGYLRALSALFSIGTIPIVYKLGRKLFNSTAACSAALLLCVNTFYVQYAQEIRAFSMLVFFTTLSSYLFILCIEKQTVARRIGYVIIASLALYTHQFALLMIGSQFASLFLLKKFKDAFIHLLPLGIGIGLLTLPLALLHIPQNATDWIHAPTAPQVLDFIQTLAGGRLLVLLGCAITMIAGGYAYLTTKPTTTKITSWYYLFTLVIFLVPISAAIVISITIEPIFVPRYLLYCIVPFYLLIGHGLASLHKYIRVPLTSILVLGSLTILLSWYGYPAFTSSPQYPLDPKEDWRGVTNYVLTHASPSDTIFFYAYYIHAPFEYYTSQYLYTHPTYRKPVIGELSSAPYTIGGLLPDPNKQLIQSLAKTHTRIWLVLSHNRTDKNLRQQQTDLIESLLTTYYTQTQIKHFQYIDVISYQ